VLFLPRAGSTEFAVDGARQRSGAARPAKVSGTGVPRQREYGNGDLPDAARAAAGRMRFVASPASRDTLTWFVGRHYHLHAVDEHSAEEGP
jgi:hypothetical protein